MQNESGLIVTGDKVLVKPWKVEEKTAGGIILAESTKEKEQMAQQIGQLVAIGPGAEKAKELIGISLGDAVVFPRYPGAEFFFDGERYWVMRVDSILGKLTKLPDYLLRGAESSLSVFGDASQKAA